jgi:hypothetical protein
LLGGAVSASFAVAARLRSAKVFHPQGVVFTGTLEIENRDSVTGRTVGAQTWPVVVRASKAIGTPGRWPDILGIAVRLHHTIGNVDLLFATVDSHVGWALAPASRWSSRRFSTLLPYEAAGQRVVLQLIPQDPHGMADASLPSIKRTVTERPVTFALTESTPGLVTQVGILSLHTSMDQTISFDPLVNEHPDLRHTRLFAGIRSAAYAGSRQGRLTNSALLGGSSSRNQSNPASRVR